MHPTPHIEPEEVEVPTILAAQLPSHSPASPTILGRTMGAAFGALSAFVATNHLAPVGPPRALYKAYNNREAQFVVAVPVEPPTGRLEGEADITVDRLPGGRALRFTHRGSHQDLHKTYEAISGWMAGAGLLESQRGWERYMPVWEEYLSDPDNTRPEELVTRIYVPMDHAKV